MEYMINGKAYPVICGAVMKCGRKVPVVDLRLMSDYEWQFGCLKDRLDHPEKYRAIGEDVNAAIARLRKWLEENKEQDEERLV